jgi:inner membrane protein
VDNITHSLVGVALAELVQPSAATADHRRVLMAGSIVAANLPDIDLAYTWITPAPLGYLLHHRGYTHTLAGFVVLAVALPLLMHAWRAVHRLPTAARRVLYGLIAFNLLGHVSLDALNNYGVHPFYPLDPRWYYGDAVFVFEPLLWLLLGIAAACNARTSAARNAVVGLLSFVILTVVAARVVPFAALVGNTLAAALFLALVWRAAPRTRTAAALILATLFLIGMSGLSTVARREAVAAARSTADVLDVIVSPDPGMPLCWSAIVVSRERGGETYLSERGTVSLAPRWYPPGECASYKLASTAAGSPHAAGKALWRDEYRQSIGALRDLARRDCRVRAWMQFGRAPVVRGDSIEDLRFDTGVRGNFTAMALHAESRGCPSNVTPWAPPRADLVGPLD